MNPQALSLLTIAVATTAPAAAAQAQFHGGHQTGIRPTVRCAGTLPVRQYETNRPKSVKVGDLDGDGDLDWVTSSYQGDWRVFTNDGDGTFTFSREFTAPTAASCALLFDFDNDRDLDIALIDELDDVVILMKNSGTFQIPTVTAWGALCTALGLLILGTLIRNRPHSTLS